MTKPCARVPGNPFRGQPPDPNGDPQEASFAGCLASQSSATWSEEGESKWLWQSSLFVMCWLGFPITTIAASVTGFFFPVQQFLPSHAIGIVSLIVLAVAGAGFWRFGLQGPWLKTYAIGAVVALYLNVFEGPGSHTNRARVPGDTACRTRRFCRSGCFGYQGNQEDGGTRPSYPRCILMMAGQAAIAARIHRE